MTDLDFYSDDPLVRHNAHQEAKGRATIGDPDALRKRLRENHPELYPAALNHSELCSWRFGMNAKCDCKLADDPQDSGRDEDHEHATDLQWRHADIVHKTDLYDAVQDARSEARYEDDPTAERDDLWRETLPEKGCGA